jgi:hypothetical protein
MTITTQKARQKNRTSFPLILLVIALSTSVISATRHNIPTNKNQFAKLDKLPSNHSNMLRQRKNPLVKKALQARGGSENGSTTANSATPPPSVTKIEKSVAKEPEEKVSKLRAAVFPIYGSEVNKFLLMGSIKFFVIMALTLTRDTKDTLVVTQCGAEAIAFLKVSAVKLNWSSGVGVLPQSANVHGKLFLICEDEYGAIYHSDESNFLSSHNNVVITIAYPIQTF